MVLSGPDKEDTYNRFSCYAVNSKLAQSTITKSKPLERLYTGTDPDNRSEIITYVTIMVPGMAGTMMMEVKVDRGAQPSCIPLHKFIRTSTSHHESSSQKKQTVSKMVTSAKVPVPSSTVHSFKDAKDHRRKRCSRLKLRGGVDISDEEQHIQDEPSATMGKKPKSSQTGNLVPSGPNQNLMDNVKDGPFRTSSNMKLGPKRKNASKQAPCRKYHEPSKDTKTFFINSQGHLQCHQDHQLIYKTNDKGKLPGSREAPIYHQPGTVPCKMVEQLKKLYPNSFDRLGSLKGEYNIRIDPTVKPAQHARWKVPIESREAIDKELDFLIEGEIFTEQVEPTPWVSSVTFPRKPNGDVQVCLDPSNLNTAIIRKHHKPMTV